VPLSQTRSPAPEGDTSEKARLRKALDDARSRIAAEAAATPAPSSVDDLGPAQRPDPAVSAPWTSPVAHGPSAPNRSSGIAETLRNASIAVPKRFMEGVNSIGAMFQPVTDDEMGRSTKLAVAEGLLGVLNVVFPFSAFGGEVGGDALRWLEGARGSMTDTALKARLDAARSGRPAVPELGEHDEVALLEGLLSIPEAQRLDRMKELGGVFSEVLSGTLPGWTSPASPAKPPAPVTR
jgi:hypothetical protein